MLLIGRGFKLSRQSGVCFGAGRGPIGDIFNSRQDDRIARIIGMKANS
jgi:hypothetical protein